MGCSESKVYCKGQNTPQQRVYDYQKESRRYMRNMKIQPNTLLPEQFGGGYISSYQFYNQFHGGFCAPYICNPNYMLIVDFRTLEEYQESHIWTALHHSFIRWDMSTIRDMQKYSYVIFYDHDGTAAANIYSHITSTITKLTASQVEVSCILGGIQRCERLFPHLITHKNHEDEDTAKYNLVPNGGTNHSVMGNNRKAEEALAVPWMPCSVYTNSIFLGSLEQARNPEVIKSLDITHIVSIGRSPDWKSKDVQYVALDGERNLYFTFLKASEVIQSAVEKGGKVLVHGVEGLNRSAAVIMAFLMTSTTCLLDDVFVYIQSLRPHLQLDDETLECLLKWETSIFGTSLTLIDELWT